MTVDVVLNGAVVERGRGDVLAFHGFIDILLFFVESKNFRVKLDLRDI